MCKLIFSCVIVLSVENNKTVSSPLKKSLFFSELSEITMLSPWRELREKNVCFACAFVNYSFRFTDFIFWVKFRFTVLTIKKHTLIKDLFLFLIILSSSKFPLRTEEKKAVSNSVSLQRSTSGSTINEEIDICR